MSQYDLAGRRTRLYWPAAGGQHDYVESVWNLNNQLFQMRENGVWTKPHLLFHGLYDDLGRLWHVGWGNDSSTNWTFQADSADYNLAPNPVGTAQDVTFSLAFNPAAQVLTRGITNPLYSFAPAATPAEVYVPNGLNQYASVAGTAFTHDDRGNLTSDGQNTYTYDLENRLTAISGGSTMTLAYDPLGRLHQTTSASGTTQFLYDGDRLVSEYDGSGVVTARYAHAGGVDNPVVWYAGSTLTDRRWLQTDTQGSIIATTGADGTVQGTPYTYSPYGEPDAAHGYASGSRFRYTGQITLRDAPLWHYKARVYSPELGRFLQTDPIGYEGQMNLYAYVGNDPVNGTDPTGMIQDPSLGDRIREAFGFPQDSIPPTISITGGTAEDRSALRGALEDVQSTDHFSIMEDQAMARGASADVTIHATSSGGDVTEPFVTGGGALGADIYINTRETPIVMTSEGPMPASLASRIGHEIGHAFTGVDDDGLGRMNNTNRNENPVRRELGEPPRTRYRNQGSVSCNGVCR